MRSNSFSSALLLTLLLVGVLVLVFEVQLVGAGGTVYIRADGSIDPPSAPISSLDNVTYTFIGNVNDSIVVERDNIVVDGAGYAVQGTGSGNGIDLSGRSNVTVKNVSVVAFNYGIYLNGGSGNTLTGNNITANANYGIYLDGSTYNSIINNNIANNVGGIKLYPSSDYNNVSDNNIIVNSWGGIDFWFSKHNKLFNNNITANGDFGMLLDASSNITMRNNTMAKNGYNFGIRNPINSINDIDASNTVDSKPIYYWINKQDAVVPPDAGYVALVSCNNITVTNLNLTNNIEGVLLCNTANSTITQNTIANNLLYGAGLCSSSNGNVVSCNNVTSNSHGIAVTSSSNCIVSYNNITNNDDGIALYYSSANNVIYHNNFVNNTSSVYPSYAGENVWDNGYPSGGNYWSDYKGVDQKRGPNQNMAGSDGIGDTPYVINSKNRDRYPLMSPWIPPPDINKDGLVDVYDLVIVAIAFNFTPSDPNWNPNADLNKDNTITIQDLTVIAIHYGETTP